MGQDSYLSEDSIFGKKIEKAPKAEESIVAPSMMSYEDLINLVNIERSKYVRLDSYNTPAVILQRFRDKFEEYIEAINRHTKIKRILKEEADKDRSVLLSELLKKTLERHESCEHIIPEGTKNVSVTLAKELIRGHNDYKEFLKISNNAIGDYEEHKNTMTNLRGLIQSISSALPKREILRN